jgi:hypothetical protein
MATWRSNDCRIEVEYYRSQGCRLLSVDTRDGYLAFPGKRRQLRSTAIYEAL